MIAEVDSSVSMDTVNLKKANPALPTWGISVFTTKQIHLENLVNSVKYGPVVLAKAAILASVFRRIHPIKILNATQIRIVWKWDMGKTDFATGL